LDYIKNVIGINNQSLFVLLLQSKEKKRNNLGLKIYFFTVFDAFFIKIGLFWAKIDIF